MQNTDFFFFFYHFAELLKKLDEETGPDGTVAQIGQIVIDWVCMDIHHQLQSIGIFSV